MTGVAIRGDEPRENENWVRGLAGDDGGRDWGGEPRTNENWVRGAGDDGRKNQPTSRAT